MIHRNCPPLIAAGFLFACLLSEVVAQPIASSSAISTTVLEIRRQADLKALLTDPNTRESGTEFRKFEELVTGPVTASGRPRRRAAAVPGEPGRFIPTSELLTAPVSRQPVGPLSGKVVYTSGGHGWTSDNTSTSLWYTQRPALLGMVEDFGNQDQLTVFADAAFRAGAMVVPMRPVGHQPVERVLDQLNGLHVKFQGEWADSTGDLGFRLQGTEGAGYRYARASLSETAVVRYRPQIPAQDWYPIYAYAVHGADRVPQTYRIVAGGGATEVVIDHRLVGSGWVYLGEYLLSAGDSAFVEIPNIVTDPELAKGDHVVVADAIRFGNGRGDINRGGGISGRLREEEAALYWNARALPPQHSRLAFWSEKDHDSSISSPARMAAYMNRETAVKKGQSVYLGWHSNARPETSKEQRGALTLLTRGESSRTLLQEPWASTLVDSINSVMAKAPGLPVPWNVLDQRIVSFINYGEIRIDSLGNEMPATIVESAFHDSPDDVKLLMDLRSRRLIADACVSATVAFMRTVAGEPVPPAEELLPPARPDLTLVQADATSEGLARIRFDVQGGGKLDRVVVEAGPLNGSFARVQEIAPGESVVDMKSTDSLMVRLYAEGPGGRSLPSRTLATAAAVTTHPRVLIVTAFDAEEASQTLVATDGGPFNFPLGSGGSYARVSPRMINPHDQTAVVARSLNSLGVVADSMDRKAFEVAGEGDFSRYKALIYLEGRQTGVRGGLTIATMKQLSEVGGKLPILISGSGLLRPRAGQDQLRKELASWAGVRFAASTSQTAVMHKVGVEPATSGSLAITFGLPAGYLPLTLDGFQPAAEGKGTVLFAHHDDLRLPAAYFVKTDSQPGRLTLTAPLENIFPTVGRNRLVRQFLDMSAVALPPQP
jgi:hypothetical protein